MSYKKILVSITSIIMLLTIIAGCVKYESPNAVYRTGIHHAEIVIKDYGTISLELDGDTAPITVTNFLNLAESGYYDGTTFHRIINEFMMQGGSGSTVGKSTHTIVGEFSQNGYKNNISHLRGTISMARSTDMNSASDQFFIVHSDAKYCDTAYAAFGHVTSGMEIVDEICQNTPSGENGAVEPADQPVIETIRVID